MCIVLPLSIETGTYSNVNLEDKICEFCLLNKREDENHFVYRCTKYFIHRQHLNNIVSREHVSL